MTTPTQNCPECTKAFPKGSLQLTPEGTLACSVCAVLAMQATRQGATAHVYADGLTAVGAFIALVFGLDLLLNQLGFTLKILRILDVLGAGRESESYFSSRVYSFWAQAKD